MTLCCCLLLLLLLLSFVTLQKGCECSTNRKRVQHHMSRRQHPQTICLVNRGKIQQTSTYFPTEFATETVGKQSLSRHLSHVGGREGRDGWMRVQEGVLGGCVRRV